jgi:hypothetical protein
LTGRAAPRRCITDNTNRDDESRHSALRQQQRPVAPPGTPPSALRSRRPTACLGLFSFAARLPRLPPSPDAG